MLLKLDRVCHILDLPNDIFPLDMAVNFLLTGVGYPAVKVEDQQFVGTTLVRLHIMSLDNLHPDIQRLCSGHTVYKSDMLTTSVPLNQDYQLTFTSSEIQTDDCCNLQVIYKHNIALHFVTFCINLNYIYYKDCHYNSTWLHPVAKS